MSYRYTNEEFHIYNISNRLSAYGYIYYASLSAGESYAIQFLLALLAVIGIVVQVLMIVGHMCAICFAYRHMYKTVHLRIGRSPTLTQTDNKSFPSRSYCTPQSCPVLPDCLRVLARSLCFRLCCFRWNSSTSDKSATPCGPNDSELATSATLYSSNSPPDESSAEQVLKNNSTIIKLPKFLIDGAIPTMHKPMSYPGVSIIKPLAGIDANLEFNMTSYFCLDYPNYEILFCVADKADPVCNLVRHLQTAYPHVQSRLLISTKKVGVNPKINNMQTGYEAASFDLLLVSDSGVWMRPDTLTDMVAALNLDGKIGMVHQVPFMTPRMITSAVTDITFTTKLTEHERPPSPLSWNTFSDRPSFAWIVQLIFFGCWHAKIYLCAAFFGVNCTTGMSCLLRKPVLSPRGGFSPFGRYLAEDFFLAKYFLDQGWHVRVSHQPAWQNSPSESIDQFRSRLSRWSQLRLSMVFIAYILEPFSRCLPNAILGAFSFSYFLPDFIDPGVYFLCHILVWFLLDYILLIQMYPPCVPLCITKLEYFFGWIFSELTAVPFHFSVLFKRELHWRNKRYRVRWGGVSEQIIPVHSKRTDTI